MPSLEDHASLNIVKGLYMGAAGSGKTGSLESLVAAGYKLYIYDFDNLLGSLVQYVRKNCPSKLKNIKYQTFTDKMKATPVPLTMQGANMRVQPFVDGIPNAFVRGLKQLSRWQTTEDGDLGDPGKFGKDSIVVVDSLTTLAQAAFRYAQSMNPGAGDGRMYYFSAQQMVMNVIQLLYSDQFATNVLVLAHIDYRENPLEVIKGFPRTVGGALGDQPNSYFNCVLMAEASGSGQNIKRVIRTNSTGIVDLKNPVAFKVADTLPLESGLATFFKAVTDFSPEEKTLIKV